MSNHAELPMVEGVSSAHLMNFPWSRVSRMSWLEADYDL